ncbi:cysteine dioxygenase family protein [Paludibacterium yongneupense]|uniref:cysteine dioxygenase family protein n=1 Tax=Paludibacterium yongneupense TaxID=400061 RepID=UPI0003FC850B|nr:cysteine dioxygenase family protein [Paludibacterium yongneupense]
MSYASERQQAVTAALADIREIAGAASPTRERVEHILTRLLELARTEAWWADREFPAPLAEERQARYLISEQPDQSFALYLNVMLPGKTITPHNHTTWAAIAAVEGVEFNHLYRRIDDGSQSGVAVLEHARTLEVGPGQGVALLPDDIHAVEIRGETPIRHLHLYGRSLETLTGRLAFDLEHGRCAPMAIGVATRR